MVVIKRMKLQIIKDKIKIRRQPEKKLLESTSIITLNINSLNFQIKRHRLADWIKKQNPSFCCLQQLHLSFRDRHNLKVKEWEKRFSNY